MHKNPVIVASSLALVLAAACAGDPTRGKPKAEVGPVQPVAPLRAAGPAASPATGTETLRVLPGPSTIGFVGAKVTAQHVGDFSDFDGTIALVDGAPEKSRVEFTIQVAALTVDSGGGQLVDHLRSADFFDVANHPTATFVSTTIEPGSSDPAYNYTVTGNLKLRSTEHGVSFPARIEVRPDLVAVKTEFGINRKDWGIAYPGMKDDLIKDNVLIRVTLEAPRATR